MILVIGFDDGPGSIAFANSLSETSSQLLTDTNYLEASASSAIFHTTVCKDIQISNLNKIAGLIRKIYWCPPKTPLVFTDYEYQKTLSALKTYHQTYSNVENVPDEDPLGINITPINSDPSQAIFYGCSHTVGGHWINSADLYTHQVAAAFNKTVFVPSTAFDNRQFHNIRGNFRNFSLFQKTNFNQDQIVSLQLTDFGRMRYFDDEVGAMAERKQSDLPKNMVLGISDRQLIYLNLDRLQGIVNHATSLRTKFVFFTLGNHGTNRHLVEYYLQDYKEYIPNMIDLTVDRARDRAHFGVKSNALFSEQIIKKLTRLYS